MKPINKILWIAVNPQGVGFLTTLSYQKTITRTKLECCQFSAWSEMRRSGWRIAKIRMVEANFTLCK